MNRRTFGGVIAACIVLMAVSSAIMAQTITGTALDIRTQNGRLRFGTLTTSDGNVYGNELLVESLGEDPPKVRLAAVGGAQGCVSFGQLRPDGDHDEVALICGSVDEQDRGSLGGQIVVSIRQRNATGDGAMRRMGVISAAYTDDGQPVVRWYPVLGPFAEVPYTGSTTPPPSSGPLQVLSSVNLDGDVSALAARDGAWMTAPSPGHDVSLDVMVNVPAGASSIHLETRRTSNAGTASAPYVYVSVDGQAIGNFQEFSQSGATRVVPMAPGSRRLTIHVSGQDGTVEIGAVVPQ